MLRQSHRTRYYWHFHKEVAVKRVLIMLLILAVSEISVSGIVCPASSAPTTKSSSSTKNDETQAVNALSKIGVPLQRDSRGRVRWIEASKGELNDEAMRYLPSLAQLEWLEIGGGSLTPLGIAHLKGCPTLRRLYVHDINLRGDELAWLSALPQLEALSLQRTRIDGRILKNIKASETLAVLNLSGNNIVNEDMGEIARLKDLEVLALADTKISGSGIVKLEGMQRLNELNLSQCPLLDEDLECFLSMPNLRIVYAEGCNFSDMAVQGMNYRFPMLAIFR
jgi:hypothetical protein